MIGDSCKLDCSSLFLLENFMNADSSKKSCESGNLRN